MIGSNRWFGVNDARSRRCKHRSVKAPGQRRRGKCPLWVILQGASRMSALPSKADMLTTGIDVRYASAGRFFRRGTRGRRDGRSIDPCRLVETSRPRARASRRGACQSRIVPPHERVNGHTRGPSVHSTRSLQSAIMLLRRADSDQHLPDHLTPRRRMSARTYEWHENHRANRNHSRLQ
jgi:hypothetical protein